MAFVIAPEICVNFKVSRSHVAVEVVVVFVYHLGIRRIVIRFKISCFR